VVSCADLGGGVGNIGWVQGREEGADVAFGDDCRGVRARPNFREVNEEVGLQTRR
jgi:hypothetical protein